MTALKIGGTAVGDIDENSARWRLDMLTGYYFKSTLFNRKPGRTQ